MPWRPHRLNPDQEELVNRLLSANMPAGTLVGSGYDSEREGLWFEAQVPGERARRIRISRDVLENGSTDWELLEFDLVRKATKEFADPRGCTIRIERDPKRDGQFRLKTGRP